MIMREEKMKGLIEDREKEIETLKKRVLSLKTQLDEKEEIISSESMCHFIYYCIITDKILVLLFTVFLVNMILSTYVVSFIWHPFLAEVAKESATKSMELGVDKKDVSVQFNYIIPSNGTNSIIHFIYILSCRFS